MSSLMTSFQPTTNHSSLLLPSSNSSTSLSGSTVITALQLSAHGFGTFMRISTDSRAGIGGMSARTSPPSPENSTPTAGEATDPALTTVNAKQLDDPPGQPSLRSGSVSMIGRRSTKGRPNVSAGVASTTV